jgi:hypothetical protein
LSDCTIRVGHASWTSTDTGIASTIAAVPIATNDHGINTRGKREEGAEREKSLENEASRIRHNKLSFPRPPSVDASSITDV